MSPVEIPLVLGSLVVEAGAWAPGGPGVRLSDADRRRPHTLGDEQARHLAAWLLAAVGDAPAPADPDAVRVEIDRQRAALAARSAEDVPEDFRAGLAWASHALDAVAAVAVPDLLQACGDDPTLCRACGACSCARCRRDDEHAAATAAAMAALEVLR